MWFLRLAASDLLRQPGDPFIRPYRVDVSVSTASPAVAMSEGAAHDAVAAVVTVHEALQPEWRMVVERADGLWLVPYLERLANGERLDEHELAEAFRARHGRDPETYDWVQRRDP